MILIQKLLTFLQKMKINMKLIAFYMLFLILTKESESFLFTKLKNKFKTKVAEFPSDSSLEYPGTDPQLLSEIRKLWQKYYECLEEKYNLLGPHKTVIPEAKMLFEGSSLRLDCKACVSPPQLTTTDDVKWFFTTIPPSKLTEIEYGEHIILSAEDKSLHIYNLQQENSGQYICKLGDTVMAPYYIEVVNETEPTNKVRPDSAPTASHTHPPQKIPGHNMEVFTNWEPWSPCSTCNAVGKRIRFGICTVRLKEYEEMGKNNILNKKNQAENFTLNEYSNILNESDHVESKWNSEAGYDDRLTMAELQHSQTSTRTEKTGTYTMLTLFRKGIPCRSVLLQSKFKSIPEVHKRKSEIMTGFCKEPCPGDVIFEVLDNKGKIVESANNSEGIFSTLQGIPPVTPSVARRTIYEDTDAFKIIIKCPGNLNTDKPIHWQIGMKLLNPILIQEQTNGRIYIDEQNHINMKRPRLDDSNIYSCWQRKEMAGTVRLVIKTAMRLNFNHYITILGLVVINGTFLIVCYKVYKGRKRLLG